jgi:hypothetical protein
VTEGDEIERGRLGTADGKRRREPWNLAEGRDVELRLDVEIEMDFPDGNGPSYYAIQSGNCQSRWQSMAKHQILGLQMTCPARCLPVNALIFA